MEAGRVVAEFARLQGALIGALLQLHPSAAPSIPLNLPRTGALIIGGDSWMWHQHGAGLEFVSAHGVCVDAHTAMLDHPDGVDAWRLSTYLLSLGATMLMYESERVDAGEEREIERVLEMMEHDGLLRRVGARTRLFEPVGA